MKGGENMKEDGKTMRFAGVELRGVADVNFGNKTVTITADSPETAMQIKQGVEEHLGIEMKAGEAVKIEPQRRIKGFSDMGNIDWSNCGWMPKGPSKPV